MLSKLSIALATAAVLGTAALAPSAAQAHLRGYGYGWNGYGTSYWNGPYYAYAPVYAYRPYRFYPRYYGWKRFGRY